MRIDEIIRKLPDGDYRLLSKKGKNLGTYPTKSGAEKRERQVQYFKHVGEGNKLLDKPTLSVQELADKHDVSVEAIKSQLAKGIRVELEHTSDPAIAKEIALDHIAEFPDYYDRLAKVEESDIDEGPKDFGNMNLDQKGKQDSIDYFYHTHAPTFGKPTKAGSFKGHSVVTFKTPDGPLMFFVNQNDQAVFYVGLNKMPDGVAVGNVRSNGTIKATEVYRYLVSKYGKLYSDKHQTPDGRKIWVNLAKYNPELKISDIGDRLMATEGNKAQKGIPADATLAQLDKIRSTTKDPEKRKRAHWLANMRRGQQK